VVARRPRGFDRAALLARADRHRQAGRVEEAIAGYQEILRWRPDDAVARARLAPLLARAGEREAALAEFRRLAEDQRRAGFPARAISLLKQAAQRWPDEISLTAEAAELELARGRREDAVKALLEGGRRLLETPLRPQGTKLVRRALELHPWHVEGTLLYARTLVLDRRRRDAGRLLDGLARRTLGEARRQAVAAGARLAPSPRRLWRWLRTRGSARAPPA
jgi:tetratricopeptide (TPR) repeat protein